MLKLYATVFLTIFLAELGDKTQIATLFYAADARNSRLVVFLGAASALAVVTGIAVLAGAWISAHVDGKTLSRIAGAGFILVGIWTLVRV